MATDDPGDAVSIDAARVVRLLSGQFPRWAHRPLTRVVPGGTDNILFRLGPDLVVRLPRVTRAADQCAREARWLGVLAPLPLAIPVPLAVGRPDAGFPWPWSIVPWIVGTSAHAQPIDKNEDAAEALAAFIVALRARDASGGPASGDHHGHRGGPLVDRDHLVRRALHAVEDLVAPGDALPVWRDALAASRATPRPQWLHGDLHPGNLIVDGGTLRAVIDFGLLGIGDAACDLMAAWTIFAPSARAVFRAATAADDASWARGRGWALSTALIALAYYRDRDAGMTAQSRATLARVFEDA